MAEKTKKLEKEDQRRMCMVYLDGVGGRRPPFLVSMVEGRVFLSTGAFFPKSLSFPLIIKLYLGG